MLFRNTKRWIAFAVGIALPILSWLWSAVLNDYGKKNWYVKAVYVGFIVLVAGTAGYLSQLKPARDLEKPVFLFLDQLGDGLIQRGKAVGMSPRLNLMLLRRPWYLLGTKRIQIVWGYGMDNFPDVRFACRHNAGIPGEALRTGLDVMSPCPIPMATQGFTPVQLAKTSHVTAVWSWPIYQRDSKGQQTGRLVGVVNLDATSPGAFAILQTNAALLDPDLRRFREVISMIV